MVPRMAARPPRRSSWQSNGETTKRPAEAGDSPRRDARRPVGEGRLPGARRRRGPLLLLARQDPRGRQGRAAGKDERRGEKELQKKIRGLEWALGRKTYELEIAWPGSRPRVDTHLGRRSPDEASGTAPRWSLDHQGAACPAVRAKVTAAGPPGLSFWTLISAGSVPTPDCVPDFSDIPV
jgi:hypothetical protein